jgi:hypothetical protein
MTDAINKDLKKLEFEIKPRGSFGIGISMKVKPGRLVPMRYYREKQLETEVVCAACTLRYAVYGVFAFCPDCGKHNSLQILEKNLELVDKILAWATETEKEVAEKLIENALEDCVSAFDGFGRELCRIHAARSSKPDRAQKISFQNLEGAKTNVGDIFGIDLSANIAPDEWSAVVRGFQKRHLVAHKMGVVDQEYIDRTGDRAFVAGRRVIITDVDVQTAMRAVRKIASGLAEQFASSGGAHEAEVT